MSLFRLILRSLAYHRRMNLAVALGVAVGTAILGGALVVGDAMRGSLRHLATERLGPIAYVLQSPHYLRAAAAEELSKSSGFETHFTAALPAILLTTSLELDAPAPAPRASRVQLLGAMEAFFGLHGPDGTQPSQWAAPPGPGEVILNQPLAEQLGAKVGQTVLVQLPRRGTIPAETPLGRKQDTVEMHRLTVAAVAPTEGLAQLQLRPNQQVPYNAFVALEWLQQRLDRRGEANTILVTGSEAAARARLPDWRPHLADYGLRLRASKQGYWDISSQRMLLDPALESQLLRALECGDLSPLSASAANRVTEGVRNKPPRPKTVQPALTWLANSIEVRKQEIPYSTITAVDFAASPPLGPMRDRDGHAVPALKEGEIALNSWAADDLEARVGDRIRVRYFEPESQGGTPRERQIELRLAAILAMEGAALDRGFTPDVPGVTDQRSMSNWDPPFPFDASRIRSQDEQYWDKYRGTPKAFVALATGRRLWASRFGDATTLRIAPPEGVTLEGLESSLPAALDPASAGLVFQPVKAQALAAAAGTTPFNLLFLGFSFFLMLSAVFLVSLLVRLAIQQRADELGTLLALGFSARQVRGLWLAESGVVTLVGSLLGIAAALGYAAGLVAALNTWWQGAIRVPFLRLDFTPTSLLIAAVGGLFLAALGVVSAVRTLRRASPRQLLAGSVGDEAAALQTRRRAAASTWIAVALLVAAAVVPWFLPLREELRGGIFFAAAALALAAMLWLVRVWLRRQTAAGSRPQQRRVELAWQNAARTPGRATLTIGLVASASFLVIAVSVFRLDPTKDLGRSGGAGGIALWAESDLPLHQDLNRNDPRRAAGLSAEQSQAAAPAKFYALRLQDGDDASCLNLYQPRRPRLLGLPDAFLDRGGFAWAAVAADASHKENPWQLLRRPSALDPDGVARVPVVLDQNTATYSLHLGGVGSTYEITDGRGRPLRLEVVGLLANSIFQGSLLVAEPNLLAHFPAVTGWRTLLVQVDPAHAPAVATALQQGLAPLGLSVETTAARLARFFSVQNTYLATFQSLGGLGLILGTLGLAVVQLRNVVERRRELALLQAVGFRRRTLVGLVLLENVILLALGLGVGLAAALIAVGPHLVSPSAAGATLALMLVLVGSTAAGLVVTWIAARAALRAPLLPALRGE